MILTLSLAIYFLYRHIEQLEQRVKHLENTEEYINNEPIDLTLPRPVDDEDFILPLPRNRDDDELNISIKDNELNIDFNDNIIDLNKFLNNDEKQTLQHIDDHIDEDINITLEEYSNHEDTQDDTLDICIINNEDINIYSNDNEEDDHTSLMESMIEAVDTNDDNIVSELLKNNKLPELQEWALKLNISLLRNNSSKKKTKLELAKEIAENQ
jgi:hypothetical protein